jgi:carbon storage regulator CsrA
MSKLVLSRRVEESILITAPNGDEIIITVVRCTGQAKLAIEAPRSYRVDREEIAAQREIAALEAR